MSNYTIELDWGDYLDHLVASHCARVGIDRTTLFTAVGHVTGDRSRATISKLLDGQQAVVGQQEGQEG